MTRRLPLILALSVLLHAGALAVLVSLVSHVGGDSPVFIDLVSEEHPAPPDAAGTAHQGAGPPPDATPAADRGPVAFAKGRDAEEMAEGIERHEGFCSWRCRSPRLKRGQSIPARPAPIRRLGRALSH